ncbi:hypothetical protein BJX63DRAFT_374821 [Aspergillus granulosus]|uniref:DNA replication regulator SLD2 n=1 Tax=Aspergillus granulosus TaxID=176169 RepID=A0ABR4H0L1_9EURO
MPRTLPWLTGVVKARNLSTPEIQRTSNRRVKDETPTKKQASTSRRDFFRSSPSPPSSPAHRCPSEEFLKEGLDKDDIYIMVEDEFYAVAQSFTQHLHYAEYIRRGREAKLQNATRIQDIARPTDGVTPMSETLKKKYAAEELRARQKDGVERLDGNSARDDNDDGKEALGDDIEEENSWAGTHLQDLMLSPRRVRSLVGLQGIRSSTRAAAGFGQALGPSGRGVENVDQVEKARKEPSLPDETTNDEDDDDLDAIVSRPVPTAPRPSRAAPRPHPAMSATDCLSSTPVPRPSFGTVRSTDDTKRKPQALQFENKAVTTTQPKRKLRFEDFDGFTTTPEVLRSENNSSTTTKAKKPLIFDDFDEHPALHKPNVQLQGRQPGFANTKKIKHKDKDAGSKKSRLNEVPTFII